MSAPSSSADPVTTPRTRRIPWGLGVFVVACAVFGYRLGDEPHFVDESAYVAQSYFADLFLEGRRDDPAWLTYAGFDLPPGAKYVVGIALRAGGFARGSPAAAQAWYDDTSRRFETHASLVTSRLPMVVFGALGCVAIYAIGALAFGRPAGLIAAALLMASPLYFMHSRRAMSDVPAEAMGLVGLALGLAAWSGWLGSGPRDPGGGARDRAIADEIPATRRRLHRIGSRALSWSLTLLAGAFVGLAVLCKLNGTLAGMILAAWATLALVFKGVSLPSRLGLAAATVAAGALAVATFTALDPTLTARPSAPLPTGMERVASLSPWGRATLVKDHRVEVSANGQRRFSKDALLTPVDKALAVIVQGFGRFSPLGPRHSDSTRRYDWRQDWSALIWAPLVAAGALASYVRGQDQLRRGEAATAWAVLLAGGVATAVVTSFLPLAWDRYYLSIQPWAVLLAAAALTGAGWILRGNGMPAVAAARSDPPPTQFSPARGEGEDIVGLRRSESLPPCGGG
jgi:hypothetical protein